MNALLSAALLATLLAACAADDGSTPDAGQGPDFTECAVDPSYGDVGTVPQEFSLAVRRDDLSGQAKSITYIAALNSDQDQVVIQLYRGFGVFATQPIVAGTYPLTGDELNYATCGVCIRMFADRPPTGAEPLQDMMATAGTLRVDEIGPVGSGSFRATLTGAAFEHVSIDQISFESKPVGDRCETRITNLGADVPMEPAGM